MVVLWWALWVFWVAWILTVGFRVLPHELPCDYQCTKQQQQLLGPEILIRMVTDMLFLSIIPALLPPATPENLRVDVSPHMPFSTVQPGLEEPGLLLYSLLALSIVLLFSSLCLALIVFLRGARAKPRPKEGNRKQECAILYDQEVGQPRQCVQG